jgi:hypothetical protein
MIFLDTASRISALQPPADPLVVHALAARLAPAGAELAARCSVIRRALLEGDWTAALRAADGQPTLRSLVDVCTLRDPAGWAALCSAAGVAPPAVDPVTGRAALAAVTSRPPDVDEAVPSGFRKAMRAGDPATALDYLRLWCLLEPEDTDLAAQRCALEAQLGELWLGQLIATGGGSSAHPLLDRIERLPKGLLQHLPAWERVSELVATREQERQDSLRRQLSEAVRDLPASSPESIDRAAAIAGELILSTPQGKLDAETDSGITRIRQALEARLAKARAEARIATLAADFPAHAEAYENEDLEQISAELEKLRPRLSDATAAEAIRLASVIRGIRSGRVWSRRWKAGTRVLAAAAALALIAAAGYRISREVHQSRVIAAGEDARISREQDAGRPGTEPSVESLAPAAVQPPAPLPPNPQLAEREAAEASLADEFFRRAREAEQELAQPPSARGSARVSARLGELSQLAASLPAARQREADARLAVLRASLASWRSELQDAARQTLAAADVQRRAEIRSDATPEAQRRALQQIAPLLASVQEIAETESIGLPQVLRSQFESMTREIAEIELRLAAFESVVRQWREARTDADYRRALAALAAAPFPQDPRVRAAALLTPNLPRTETLAQSAFAPGDAAAWSFAASREAPFFANPGAVPPGVLALLTDPAQREVHQYVLVTRTDQGTGSPIVLHTAGPAVTEEFSVGGEMRIRQTARVITGDGVFEREFIARLLPNGQRRGESLELGARTPEAALVEVLGTMIDPRQGVFLRPPLAFVEQLLTDEQASPLFKANLLLVLAQALETRPHETGYAFSPSARELVNGVRQITGGSVRPTAWVDPAFRSLAVQLAREFRTGEPIPLLAEAEVVATILSRLSGERFEFVGFADENGLAGLRPGLGNDQIWGFTGERLRLDRVLRTGQPPPAPLSPLYRFSGDAPAVVREVLAGARLPDASLQRIRRQFDAIR